MLMAADPEVTNPTQWVLYQDEDLLVINKPSGLRSLIDGYQTDLPYVRSVLEPWFGRLWIVHRLDKETSGVLVLARSSSAHRQLNAQFRQRETVKHYLALAAPPPEWQALRMAEPLRVNADREHRTRVDENDGKPALTVAEVTGRAANYALMRCRIETGYRHQIRAHFYQHGLWILGDELYHPAGVSAGAIPAPHLMLHAFSLRLKHPRSGAEISFEAALPPEYQPFLSGLSPE